MAVGDTISIIPPPIADGVPAGPEADVVTAPDFWPSLTISAFRAQARVDERIAAERCRFALRSGMQTALLDLAEWGAIRLDQGHVELSDVPAAQIDGESAKVLAWQRAVFCLAKAELVETYRDYDATGRGQRDEDWTDETIVQLRRDGKHAIRDLLGRARTHASLI